MSSPKFRLLLLLNCLLLPQLQIRAENDPLADKVSAFAASIEGKSTAQKPPGDKTGAVRDDQQSIAYAVRQLRLLEAAIRRNDFNTIQQISTNMPSFAPQLQMDVNWNEFMTELATGIEERGIKRAEQWYAETRTLAREVHDVCLAAAHSADLDPLLMRASALKLPPQRRDDLVMQRGTVLMSGIISTLQNYARFLDQRDAGNVKAANEILRSLNRDSSQFPVLSLEEIRLKLLPGEAEPTIQSTIEAMFSKLKSPDDIPAMFVRLKEIQNQPQIFTGDMDLVTTLLPKFELLTKALDSLKADRGEEAFSMLDRISSSEGYTKFNSQLRTLKELISKRAMAARIANLIGPQPGIAENPEVAINDALVIFKEKGEYDKMPALFKIQQIISPATSDVPALAIEHFLAARRFESVGDYLMAVSEYRAVIGLPVVALSPLDETNQALKRLQKDHPDAFNHFDGIVLEEIRSLRSEINQMREFNSSRARGY